MEFCEGYFRCKQYIDYLIVNMFMDNSDWWTGNNWRAFRRQTDLANPADKAQFKFVVWDAEYAMDPANINRNNTGFSNGALQAHGILLTHPSYKAAWKLRVQKHFETPNGVYSVSGANHVASSVFDGQMDLFEEVVTTESARWGDANRATAFSSAEWTTAAQEHRDDYIKDRRSKFLNQLKARGLANP